jgi:hypothetical protein
MKVTKTMMAVASLALATGTRLLAAPEPYQGAITDEGGSLAVTATVPKSSRWFWFFGMVTKWLGFLPEHGAQ